MQRELPLESEDFGHYYRYAPAALAIREVVRLKAVRRLNLKGPILDVGCGDGLFAKLAYPNQQSWGIDINPTEIQRAQQSKSYGTLICGNICDVDLPPAFFHSAIANCSLEHVPDIDGALRTIRGSLEPGGIFVMIVPTPDWDQHLLTPELLTKVGLKSLARAYGDALNHIFYHVHLYERSKWEGILERAGFVTERCEGIALKDTSYAFDLMLYPSVLGWVMKRLTGRWVLAPGLRSLSADLSRAIINRIGNATPDSDGATEFMFVCRAPEAEAENPAEQPHQGA